MRIANIRLTGEKTLLRKKKKEDSWRMVIFLMFLTSLVIAVFGIYIAEQICQVSLNEAYYGYIRDCEAWRDWTEDTKASGSAGSNSDKTVENSSGKPEESNSGKPVGSSNKTAGNSSDKTVGSSRKKTWENLSRKYNDGIYQRSLRMVSTADEANGNLQKKIIILRKKVLRKGVS